MGSEINNNDSARIRQKMLEDLEIELPRIDVTRKPVKDNSVDNSDRMMQDRARQENAARIRRTEILAAKPTLTPPPVLNTPSKGDVKFNLLIHPPEEGKDPEIVVKDFIGSMAKVFKEEAAQEAANDPDVKALAEKSGLSTGDIAREIGEASKALLTIFLGRLSPEQAKQLKMAIAYPESTQPSHELKEMVNLLGATAKASADTLGQKYGFEFSPRWDPSVYFNKTAFQQEVTNQYDTDFEHLLAEAGVEVPLTPEEMASLRFAHYSPEGKTLNPTLSSLLLRLNEQAMSQVRLQYTAIPGFTPSANTEFFNNLIEGGFLDEFKKSIEEAFNFAGKTAEQKKQMRDYASRFLANPQDPAIPIEMRKQLAESLGIAKKFTIGHFGLDTSWKPSVTSLSPSGVLPEAYDFATAKLDVMKSYLNTGFTMLAAEPPSPDKDRNLSALRIIAEAMNAVRDCLWVTNMSMATMAKTVCEVRVENAQKLYDEKMKALDDAKPTFWEKFVKGLCKALIYVAMAVILLASITNPATFAIAVALTVAVATVTLVGECLDPPQDLLKEQVFGKLATAIKDGCGEQNKALGNFLTFVTTAVILLPIALVSPQVAISIFFQNTDAGSSFFQMFGMSKANADICNMAAGTVAQLACVGRGANAAQGLNINKITNIAIKLKSTATLVQTGASAVQGGFAVRDAIQAAKQIDLNSEVDQLQARMDALDEILKLLHAAIMKGVAANAKAIASLGELQSDAAKSFAHMRFGRV